MHIVLYCGYSFAMCYYIFGCFFLWGIPYEAVSQCGGGDTKSNPIPCEWRHAASTQSMWGTQVPPHIHPKGGTPGE